jgi:glycosyltransferase involved in cell wall biosynthesis
MQPKLIDGMVSVIVPSYKTAGFIGETLDSIFAQTYSNYEVIVVNDGSPDTPALEKVLANYSGRIRYLHQQNHGSGSARNLGMRNACGEFLAFVDSDDLWMPNFLAEQLRYLLENPAVDMVCADCVFFGKGDLDGKSWQSLDPIEPPVTLEKLLPTHGGAFLSFALLRTEIALAVGFFEEELRVCEDYNYWLRLLYCGGELAYSAKILGKRRIHPESLTYDASVVLPHAIVALEKFVAMLDPSGRQAAMVRREISRARSQLKLKEGRRNLDLRDYQGARESFAAANAAVSSIKLRATLLGLNWLPQWTRWAVSKWKRNLNKKT